MVSNIQEEATKAVFAIRPANSKDIQAIQRMENKSNISNIRASSGGDGSVKREPVRTDKKIGRNEPCPCGSGKKYKQCCGKNE